MKIINGEIEIPTKTSEEIKNTLKLFPVKMILKEFNEKIKTEINNKITKEQKNEIKDVLMKQKYFGSKELENIFKQVKK